MKHFTWFADGHKARFNSEKHMDYNQPSLGISEAEAVAAIGLPHWNQKETPGSGKFFRFILKVAFRRIFYYSHYNEMIIKCVSFISGFVLKYETEGLKLLPF